MEPDILTDPFEAAQAAVAARLDEILDAARTKELDRLASYHLDGPKFTKFDDFEPLDRQDAATAMRTEAEGLAGIEDFAGRFADLKIDVFGRVAIATAVLEYSYQADGEDVAGRSRSTLVLVEDAGQWLIAHEHLSPFVGNPTW